MALPYLATFNAETPGKFAGAFKYATWRRGVVFHGDYPNLVVVLPADAPAWTAAGYEQA